MKLLKNSLIFLVVMLNNLGFGQENVKLKSNYSNTVIKEGGGYI